MRYKKKVNNMSAILSIQNHISKKNNPVGSYSIIDMITNPVKRRETYNYYNENYVETDDEKEIFEAWQKRYSKGDD